MKTENDIEKVKLFVRGNLKGDELKAFKERLVSDKNLHKLVTSYQLMMEVAELYSHKSQFMETAKLVSKKQVESITYSYEELIKYFKVNDQLEKDVEKSYSKQKLEFEPALKKGNKEDKKDFKPPKEIKLISPKNEIDAKNKLKFELKKGYDSKLLVNVFNNKGARISFSKKEVSKGISLKDKGKNLIITKNAKKFSLSLKKFKPGIYYWSITFRNEEKAKEYKTITQSFYIQKDLKPEPPKDLS